eukprot:scaffold22676_cov102-Cylindrotheca_fusiformis.AAC.2
MDSRVPVKSGILQNHRSRKEEKEQQGDKTRSTTARKRQRNRGAGSRKKLEKSKTSRIRPVNVSTHLGSRNPGTTNTVVSGTKNGNAKASTDKFGAGMSEKNSSPALKHDADRGLKMDGCIAL